MSKLLMTLVAGAFAAMAVAQTPAPTGGTKAPETKTTEAAPADAAAARRTASQVNVKSATAGTEKGYTRSAGEAATKAKATQHHPKVTPDAASKQAAVKSATAGTEKGHTRAAGEQAAKAASDTPKQELPKPQAGTPEMKKLVP